MKKVLLILSIFYLGVANGQIMQPADSLTGEYIGKSWYYNAYYSTTWTITDDTTYVTLIDTINCTLYMHNHFGYWFPPRRLITRYYSCDTVIPPDYTNVPSIYYYTLFHSGDSLTDCEYSIPQPQPYPHYYYYFYGKRISNNTAEGVGHVMNMVEMNISPNPFSTSTTLHSSVLLNNATLTVYNCFGQKVKEEKNITGQSITLTQDGLPSGLYFIRLMQNSKTLATEKIIVTDK